MITEELNDIATGLRRLIAREKDRGEFGDDYERQLIAVIEPQPNETTDAYRRRVVPMIDRITRDIGVCTDYLRFLDEDVRGVDYVLARKLYQAYRARKLAINRPLWETYLRPWDEKLLRGDA